MPTVRENRYWDKYPWPQDGDEWSDRGWRFAVMAERPNGDCISTLEKP